MNCSKERILPIIIFIGGKTFTERVADDQEIQVDAIIEIISQFQIEELICRVFPIPSRNLYFLATLLGIQPDLFDLIRILPGTRIDIEFSQYLDRNQCAIKAQLRVLRQAVESLDRDRQVCIPNQLGDGNVSQVMTAF